MAIRLQYTDGGREQDGFAGETNDCAVRALAIACDIPYAKAHGLLKAEGRRHRKGTKIWMITAAAKKADIKLEELHVREPKQQWLGGRSYTCPTLAEIIRQHPTGRYLLVTRNHALAVVDGVVRDKGEISGSRSRVKWVFKVAQPGPKQEITQAQVNELWERLNRLEAK